MRFRDLDPVCRDLDRVFSDMKSVFRDMDPVVCDTTSPFCDMKSAFCDEGRTFATHGRATGAGFAVLASLRTLQAAFRRQSARFPCRSTAGSAVSVVGAHSGAPPPRQRISPGAAIASFQALPLNGTHVG